MDTLQQALNWAKSEQEFGGINGEALGILAAEVIRLGENAKLRIDELDRLLMEKESLREQLSEAKKERTLEITEKLAPWVRGLTDVMRLHYPECFDDVRGL